MEKTAPTEEADMVIDLKTLDMEGHTRPDTNTRTKNHIFAAITSNERPENVKISTSIIRQTNIDVHMAYS